MATTTYNEEERHVKGKHLIHSHAHEEGLPGTVNLQATEGDDTAYGQALFPVPSQDPNDPLQWPTYKKTMILIVCSAYSFIGNCALLGISPYIQLFSAQFGVSPTVASTLVSYPNLAFGFSSLIWVPLYLKIGRRPVILATMIVYLGGLIATAQATTFEGLMAARVVSSFGSGVCEALPVQLVNDIFFIHERGKRIGYYTVCLCLAAVSPLAAGYMLTGGYSWRLFFYVCIAFSAVLFILAVLFVEETSYDRKAALAIESASLERPEVREKTATEHSEVLSPGSSSPGLFPRRKTYLQTLAPWGRIDRNVSFFTTMVRSFSYFLVPQALWVITTYGMYIGLGAFVISFTFPIKITSPPYNWDVTSGGLHSVAGCLGYLLAIPFTSSSDRLAARLTRKNGGIREAEMRLGVLLPAMVIGPVGLIVYGIAAERNLHWISYFFGSGLLAWSSYFYFSFTIAYAVDSYFANTSEMLIAINIGKQAISFGLGGAVLTWVAERGHAVVISGIFGAVLVANNLMLIVFMVWGKGIRRYMARSWLARLHAQTVREVMTH